MSKSELSEVKRGNEAESTDFNTLLARLLLEKSPEIQQFLIGVAQKGKEFIESPQTQEFAKRTVLSFQKLNQTLSDPAFLEGVSRFFQLPQKRREAILAMSESGWFPFEESIRSIPLSMDSIDEYMIGIIRENYEKIKVDILEKYTERREILECAFKLLEDGNDIAAIPLLLTQIDGISQDNHGEYYFVGKNFPRLLKEKAQLEWDEHTYCLLSAVIGKAHKTFISNRFDGVKGKVNKINILNRNGILHGDREFLNYGEEINTYKVFSLLLYVDWMSELLNEENK